MDSSEEEKDLTDDDVLEAIVRDAKRYTDALNGDDVPEEGPNVAIPQHFREHRHAKLCWNLAFKGKHRALLKQVSNSLDNKNTIIELGLGVTRTFKRSLRTSIWLNVELIVSLGAEKALTMFKVFLSMVRVDSQQQDNRKSIDALSDKSSVAAAQVVFPLTAEDVHHNMFTTSGGFRVQDFVRFDFPKNFERGLSERYGNVVEELDMIQQFLNIAKPRADETLTQAVFSLFMERFLEVFHDVESIPKIDRCAAAPVTEMTPVIVPVVIAEQYMRDNQEMNEIKNESGTFLYSGSGDWHTTLSIQSDLVLYPLSTSCTGSKKSVQLDRFRACHVNIEMKRFRLLVGNGNMQWLTQVSAQSLARKSLLDEPKALYSLLTDHRGFYVLCHFVTEENSPDQYLISRQETDPRRVVFLLRWLLKTSQEAGDVDNIYKWLMEHQVTSYPDDPTLDDDAAKKPIAEMEDRPQGHGGPASKRSRRTGSSEPAAVVVTADQLFGSGDRSVGSSSNDGPDWEFFYAQLAQRQTGKKFQFSGGPLAS